MRFRVPKLLQNSVIYTGISVLQKGISFFLLPLYTAYLTPSDYGVMNVVLSLSSLVSLVILLGLSGAGTRFVARHPEDEEQIRILWGSIASFVLINSVIVGGLFIAFHRFLVDPLTGNISFYPYLLLGIANVIVTPMYLLFQDYLKSRQMGGQYGINTLTNFLVNTFLIIYFVAILKKGVVGVLLANLITSVLYFIYVLIFFIPKLKLGINKTILKPAFRYSLPLIPHLLASWSSGMIDRLLLNGLKDEKDAGLYSVANQFGNIVLMIATAFNSAYTPWFFRAYDEKRYSEIGKVGLITVIGYCSIAFLISFFSPEVLGFMVTEQFREVWTIIPLLCFAYVFQGLYYLFGMVLFLEKTNKVFIVTILALIINIILNIFLIPRYGYYGAAIACFISFFVKSIIALVLSKKYESNLRFRWLSYYLLVISTFCLTFTNYLFIRLPLYVSGGIKLVLIIGVFSILLFKYKNILSYYIKSLFKK